MILMYSTWLKSHGRNWLFRDLGNFRNYLKLNNESLTGEFLKKWHTSHQILTPLPHNTS